MYKVDGPGNDNGQFVDEDLPNHIPGSELPAEWMNALQAEIINVILAAGITLNKANSSQLLAAITQMVAGTDLIVRYTTTANIALTGLPTQAGGDWPAALTAGNLILVKNQTVPQDNGWYIAAGGTWPRVPYLDSSAEITPSKLTKVSEGATLADSMWMLTTDAPIVLNASALNFERKDQALSKASNAEVLAGIDNTKYVTPAALLAGLLGAGGTSGNDYITFPYRDKTDGSRKNLIIQIGTVSITTSSTGFGGQPGGTVTFTLPFSFPNGIWHASLIQKSNIVLSGAFVAYAYPISLNQVQFSLDDVNNSTNGTYVCSYLLIGT